MQVVFLRLLEVGVVAFEQELLGLEVVARVVFVRDGYGYEVYLLQVVDEVAVAGQSQHLDERLLRAVVRVFRPAFALGNPDRLLLLGDGKVDIPRELPGRFEHLSYPHVAFHDKAFVEPHQVGYPVEDEQIVSDGDFAGVEAMANEQQVEQRGIENDVAVVRHVGIVLGLFEQVEVLLGETFGRLLGEHFEKGAHDEQLKIFLVVEREQLLAQYVVVDIAQHIAHGVFEFWFFDQDFHLVVEFAVVKRPDIVKFFWAFHNSCF